MKPNNRVRIAIQKSGKLTAGSWNLLSYCDISFKIAKEQLFCQSDNFPLDILLVRDDDIPQLINEGICDFGIVGTNVLQEKIANNATYNYKIIRYLGFANCRLSIAISENSKNIGYKNLLDLKNQRIATSYPNLLTKFLLKNNIEMEIITLSGSVEIAPRLGIAEAICDLVSTGATLKANNLREVEKIFNSEAVLIKSNKLASTKKDLISQSFENKIRNLQLIKQTG